VNSTTGILGKFIKLTTNVGLFLASISTLLMTFIIFLEIISRSVFNFSLLIADEMAGYLNIAIVFLGLAYTFKTGGFIKITVIYDFFSSKVKFFFDICSMILAFLYGTVIFYIISKMLYSSYINETTSLFISETPLYIPQTFMVVGVAFLLMQIIHGFNDFFSNEKEKGSE